MTLENILLLGIVSYILFRLLKFFITRKKPKQTLEMVTDEKGKVLHLRLVPDKEGKGGLKHHIIKKSTEPKPFNEEIFLKEARIAFKGIAESFAKGNMMILKPFLSKELFEEFELSIKERQEKKQTVEFFLYEIISAKVIENTNDKEVVVEFISDQANILRDENGVILEGSDIDMSRVKDVWTFEKGEKMWFITSTDSQPIEIQKQILSS